MKKLGLIGGTGPESTIVYYRDITQRVAEKTGAFPYMTIESMSVYDVLGFCAREDYDGLAAYLLRGIRTLADAGVDAAALTGITPHVVFDQLRAGSPIPLISMVDAARDYAAERGMRCVALLGTKPTMAGTFFQTAFAEKGIEVVTPTKAEQDYVHSKIADELELGQVLPQTVDSLAGIAKRLVRDEQAQAVVLGCTELPLALGDADLGVEKIDVMQVHIDRLIDFVCESDIPPIASASACKDDQRLSDAARPPAT